MRLPRLDVRHEQDAVVARLANGSDVDLGNAVELGQMLLEAVPNSARGLVLDLSDIRYVDSAGVRMLFGLARDLTNSRQSLALALPADSPLQRLMTITHVEQVALLRPDVQQCVQAVCAPPPLPATVAEA